MTVTGFVGLGQIGHPMALRLENPVVFDVRAEATGEFANVARSAAEVAERCDVVSIMVRDDMQVREVADEMTQAAGSGTVLAVHSTISPGVAEEPQAASTRFDDMDPLAPLVALSREEKIALFS
jgi:3-hydroxyisobutyrate dehydrogenase-like beta-hydroxyacid dehydrogenase